jgi:hypothetical protein
MSSSAAPLDPRAVRYRAGRLVHLWGRAAVQMAERYVAEAERCGSAVTLAISRNVLGEVRRQMGVAA